MLLARSLSSINCGSGLPLATSVRLPDAFPANYERKLPAEYIRADGFGITVAARTYLAALIQGEADPPYVNGLPDYVQLQNRSIEKRLAPYSI